jgi:hypothetical protein
MTENKTTEQERIRLNKFCQTILSTINPGQNIWQKCHSISLPPISMLFAPIHLFFPEDLTENSNIDIWGGTSVPKI